MPSDAELKRLHWRAHHRGTREADMLIGGFFDAHHASWDAHERALFAAMLDEQDVDIMAWANGTADAAGALRRADDGGAADARLHPGRR